MDRKQTDNDFIKPKGCLNSKAWMTSFISHISHPTFDLRDQKSHKHSDIMAVYQKISCYVLDSSPGIINTLEPVIVSCIRALLGYVHDFT